MCGFDPVTQYVQRLEARYGGVAAFFADSYGGRAIGIKWASPAHVGAALDLCAAHAHNAGLSRGKIQGTTLAAPAVLADMACMGAGLVAGVHSF